MARATPPEPAGQGATVLCARCSGGFACGADDAGCWCSTVMVDDGVRRDMARFYDGCLCPQCLTSIEAGRPERQSVAALIRRNLRRSPGTSPD